MVNLKYLPTAILLSLSRSFVLRNPIDREYPETMKNKYTAKAPLKKQFLHNRFSCHGNWIYFDENMVENYNHRSPSTQPIRKVKPTTTQARANHINLFLSIFRLLIPETLRYK